MSIYCVPPDMKYRHSNKCPYRVDNTLGMHNICKCTDKEIMDRDSCFGGRIVYGKTPTDWITNVCTSCGRSFIELFEQTICNKCNELDEALRKEKVTREMVAEMVADIRLLYKENLELKAEIRRLQIKSRELIPMVDGNKLKWYNA